MFEQKKVLVVGDFMLDVYTMGDVHRISPEAPVPVLRVTEEIRRPGGAGNTILNLISLGMNVVAMGRVGDDHGGRTFLEEMREEEVDRRGILIDTTFQTPLKNRMIAAGQQIVRVDYEHSNHLNPLSEEKMIDLIPSLLHEIDIVAISDYAKGFLTPALLSAVIAQARKRAIPIVVDPKGKDFTRYQGATLIKPNLQEAIAAADLKMEATLDAIAERILHDVAIDTLVVTRSKEGISTFSSPSSDLRITREDFPADVHEVKDVTGAGDTVLAVITAALANQLPLNQAVLLANRAAGLAVQRIGCARISLSDLFSFAGV